MYSEEIEAPLEGKKVLLLSVRYFGYEKAIQTQLESFGANVDFYDERPANSILVKGIIRLLRSVYQRIINAYYRRLLRETEGILYDYLFVLRGEVVPVFFLAQFTRQQSKAKMIFYTWDSFKNNAHSLTILPYFDKKYTFDSEDAKEYQLIFKPLFFIDQYAQLMNEPMHITHKLLFLGTAHSDRYAISQQVFQWCSRHNLSTFGYYYCQSRLVYLYKKLFDPSFKKFNYAKLSFQPLPLETILKLYMQSSVILDINHPGQTGLTMRTFEALGAGKKIITTNAQVVTYPFYDEHNILVIDREQPEIGLNLDFFNTPFISLSETLQAELSLSAWVCTLFSETKQNDLFTRDDPPFYWNARIQ